jgi:hypothetical protein
MVDFTDILYVPAPLADASAGGKRARRRPHGALAG